MAPITIQQAFDLALQRHQAGQLQEAEQLYRQILSQQPKHPGAMHYLGIIAHQAGQTDIAVDLIGRAIALNPNLAEVHSNLGLALKDNGQLDEAIAAYRRAITLNPNLPEAHTNLGLALVEKGQLDEAISAHRQAIALRPNYADAHYNLGVALKDNGRLDDAIAAYRQAITLRPNYAQAYSNLGIALKDKGQLDEAIAAFHQAIALNPNFPEAHNNLGVVLTDKGQLDQAIAAYQQAVSLRQDYAEAHHNLGIALASKGRFDEAVAAYRQAIALRPDYAEAYNSLGAALKDQGQLDETIAAFQRAIDLRPNYVEAHSNLAYTMHFHPAYNAKALAEEHHRWNTQHAQPLRKFIQPHSNDANPDRRLRIGYVSPDFREHPIGRFLLPLLSNHDKNQVEIFGYSHVPVPDAITEQIRSCTQEWRSISKLSDATVVDLIRQDQIDILVDLTMHMADNRLLIFARKPAPVQVTYLAYCSSTGLETIDYRLSDPYLDPPAEESFYTEQTIRLPETYWCYPSAITSPAVNPLPALAHGTITFGCLNNFCKISQPALASWTSLLRALPNSQLLLSAHEGSHRQRMQDQLQREEIEPKRVRFVGKMPMQDYFRLYHEIDIALDTFPYAGGTTTCDALWMGVPTVSLCGKTAVGRGGLSILSNIGLPELVAHSQQEYMRIATELAHDLPRLSNLRSTLRSQMEQSPLMDAPRFARNIEAVYRQMWRRWCQTTSAGR